VKFQNKQASLILNGNVTETVEPRISLKDKIFVEFHNNDDQFPQDDYKEEKIGLDDILDSSNNYKYKTNLFCLQDPKRDILNPHIFVIKRKDLVYKGKDSCLITINDVTTQMKFQDAQRKIEVLNSLQASVSHDMKAPLNAITKSMSMVLKKKMVVNEEAEKLLRVVMTSSRLLQFQINDLLD